MDWRFEVWKVAMDWRLWVLLVIIWGTVLLLSESATVARGQHPVEVTPL